MAGDEVHGGNLHLRTELERREIGYVLAVAHDHQVTTSAGKLRADALIKKLPKPAWQKLSGGAGARGHRFYGRALADIVDDRPPPLLFTATGALAPSTSPTQQLMCRCLPWCRCRTQMDVEETSSLAKGWPDWTNKV
ncbi:hypothetical protein ACTWQF_28270 [Streptomyces sp. 8N114]|uniref:hypothetical protein n=1 Tax=Streptomyces sp. 8N114 TaxID=3457419 RepID=UPI003FD3DA79